MSRISPTLEGFRAAFRRPSFTLAEISWRWSIGATGCALFAFGAVEYLRSLSVTPAELLLLRTRQPFLVTQAISHVLRGSLNRAVAAALIALLALMAVWIFAASLGRNVTVRALQQYFADRRHAILNQAFISAPPQAGSMHSLAGLNFLRAALVLSVVFGLQAAAILAGFVSTDDHPHPAVGSLIFVALAAFVFVLGWVLNWFLSLAALFAVRDSTSTLGALAAAVTFVRNRLGPVAAVSIWTAIAHIMIFTGATTIISIPLAFVQIVPARLILAVVLLLTLIYFALADWLYMARLAGYVCIAEMPEELLRPARIVPPPASPPILASQTIDRDELILSDVPSPLPSA